MIHVPSIWLWAARDLIRRPFESILLASALSLVIIVAASSLMLSQGISKTAEELLAFGPSIVVRRVASGHWVPVPVDEAVKSAISVTGVISAKSRIWGLINGPEGPVTVMGIPVSDDNIFGIHPEPVKFPGEGEALIGAGVLTTFPKEGIDSELFLSNGRRKLNVKVIGVLPAEDSMAVHDFVLLHEKDARYILELEHGYASDLAIKVFHDQESYAILPELAAAFPWPVSLTVKNDTLKIYTASAGRRAGLVYLALIPSLPALALIVAASFKSIKGRMYEAGLLKAMGWTTRNIVGFFMCRSILIAIPACSLGMAISYALVYFPGISWPGYLFFGWESSAAGLYLNPAGSMQILLQVAAGVLLPYLAANLWPAIETATADPHQLLQEEGG